MSVFHNNALIGASGQGAAAGAGYTVERSIRLNSSDSAYLNRTPSSAGNQKTWTWSGWVKRSRLGSYPVVFSAGASSGTTGYLQMSFEVDTLQVYITSVATFTAQAKFRDPSAWYHIVLAVDTTAGTASDRLKVYVNGSAITFTSAPTITQNTDLQVNATAVHQIGAGKNSGGTTSVFFDGCLAEVILVDGQALDPTDFGEFDATTGAWNPIAYSGTFPGNSFHLDFSDNSSSSALGTDAAGSNDWTVNNISVATGAGNDSLFDSPTNGTQTDTGAGGEVSGSYATLSPLDIKGNSTTQHTLSNGNLQFVSVAGNNLGNGKNATFAASSGKWYWEITASSLSSGQCYFGFTIPGYTSGRADNVIAIRDTGAWYNTLSGATVNAANLSAFSNGDVIGFALDLDNQKFSVSVNGTFHASANPAAGTNPNVTLPSNTLLTPTVSDYYTGTTLHFNFGQRPFAYTAPSGFKALCTANLDDPTIADGSTAMDVLTWTGDGTGSRSFTGLSFSPDFAWVKTRSVGYTHVLWDIVRGAGVSKELQSDSTNAEGGASTNASGYLSAFNSDGFSSTAGTSDNDYFNRSATTYVGWAWDGGSSTAANTDGSISSSVRANASAGFSIVSYTGNGTAGSTIGHGLNVKPAMIWVKTRDNAYVGVVYHEGVDSSSPQNYYMQLFAGTSGTSARLSGIAVWNNTAPTSSVFSVHSYGVVNASSENYIAYCWAPVEGYSAFGSYTGNGSTDGTFVYTGFRPRWVLRKRSDSTGNWGIVDAERLTYNLNDSVLFPDLSFGEQTSNPNWGIDILSNGFKVRSSDAATNASGGTYIYAAFAETPQKFSRAR